MTQPLRVHALVSVLYVCTRAALALAGLRFSFSLDWMWLSDPADLRDRLAETLFYFHAFPPGMNAVTGLLLKSGADAAVLAQGLFLTLGLVSVNALLYLGRAAGLPTGYAAALTLAFSLTPASLYFEHLYLYEWPVATLLCLAAALFHRGVYSPAFGSWFAFFAVTTAIAITRSAFHLVWFAAVATLAAWLSGRGTRRAVIAASIVPAPLLVALYSKNLILFGEFAASTFGPSSYTLVTVARLPADVRDAWIEQGRLSPFAAISVYAPPRAYAGHYATPDHDRWPPPLTRLEHRGIEAPNFNHWWLLDVHRARRADALEYLRDRPFEYARNVASGLRDMFGPSTAWHPRDGTAASPHFQHQQVLGVYNAWFNRVLHRVPVAPVGLYVFLPVMLVWAIVLSRRLLLAGEAAARARGALLIFCVFQVLYVVAASVMLTSLESARYRFQVEWAIWLISAACIANLIPWPHQGLTSSPGGATRCSESIRLDRGGASA